MYFLYGVKYIEQLSLATKKVHRLVQPPPLQPIAITTTKAVELANTS